MFHVEQAISAKKQKNAFSGKKQKIPKNSA